MEIHPTENIVECKDVTIMIDQKEVLQQVSCSIPMNKVTFLVGENGSGKTSLVRAILGLLPITTGRIAIRQLLGKCPVIGYVPQSIAFPKQFQLSVAEYLKYSAGVPLNSADTVLEKVDFPRKLSMARITELSGGQTQKFLLAAELFRRPDLLLLDEPLANIDDSSGKHIIDVIMGIKNLGVSIVIITHDWQTVSKYADHVICLNRDYSCDIATNCMCRNSLSSGSLKTIQKGTAQ